MERANLWKPQRLFVLLVILTIVGLFLSGAFGFLHDRQRVEDFFQDSGALGPLIYVLSFVAAQPLSLPGAALIIPATFVWTWWQVFIYSMLGGIVASCVGFALSRWIAQEWVRKRLPKKLLIWDQRIQDNAFAAVVALRLIAGYAPAADWVLGISKVRWRDFFIGTVLGLGPITLLLAIFGDDTVRWVQTAPLLVLSVLLFLGCLVIVVKKFRHTGN
ncbi:MAG: VTT domain-containing protein [Acidimicrobiales bacterium]|nr:VTT domain-containing protein [Acidimicrobiales bacterium]